MARKVRGDPNIEYLIDDGVYAISLNEAASLVNLLSEGG